MMILTFLKILILIRKVYYLPILAFLDKGCKSQPDVCSGFLDKLIMCINLNDVASLDIHDVDSCCIINGIRKSETVKVMLLH